MKKCDAKEGHLVLFDRRDEAQRQASDQSGQSGAQSGGQVTVWML